MIQADKDLHYLLLNNKIYENKIKKFSTKGKILTLVLNTIMN